MALLGQGVLAIWNGITAAAETEFVRWHVCEHIPERVGLPGFLRGRRYIAHEGRPKYFNFYETETVETLVSPQYRARLNAPTPWTQAVIKEFKDMSRTICKVAATLGRGEGAWVDTIRCSGAAVPEAFTRTGDAGPLDAVARADGIVGVHVLAGIDAPGNAPTTESRLRGRPDGTCDWILLIEAAELEFLTALRGVTDEACRRHAAGAAIERGIYRLQFGLTHSELGRAEL